MGQGGQKSDPRIRGWTVHGAPARELRKTAQNPVDIGLESFPGSSKFAYSHLWITLWIRSRSGASPHGAWHCTDSRAKISKILCAAVTPRIEADDPMPRTRLPVAQALARKREKRIHMHHSFVVDMCIEKTRKP
jgi:hypothetical protein